MAGKTVNDKIGCLRQAIQSLQFTSMLVADSNGYFDGTTAKIRELIGVLEKEIEALYVENG